MNNETSKYEDGVGYSADILLGKHNTVFITSFETPLFCELHTNTQLVMYENKVSCYKCYFEGGA